jgi:signal peptidase I
MPSPLRRLLTGLFIGMSVLAVVGVGIIATGKAGFVVTHGVSMNPVYYQGDLVIITRKPSYDVGQIVAYHRPGHSGVVLHRIVGGDGNRFIFKGDNNPSVDPSTPTRSQLAGRAVLHIPQGGLWLERLTSPTALGLMAFALLTGSGRALQTRRSRRNRRKAAVPRHASGRSALSLSLSLSLHVSSLSPQLRTGAALTAGAGVLGLALAALGWTGPVDSSSTTQVRSARQMTFSYDATVPRTPAYDSITVTSPDPVFRTLANTVEAHFAYRGEPGTVTVAAILSTPGGWHSNIPLTAAVRFSGEQYQGTVRLDLKAFEARAKAAAAVTGLQATPVSIALTASVRTADGQTFRPTLALTLTPLQLSLADTKALTVTDTTTASQRTRAPRLLSLYGWHIRVSTARTVSAVLLVLTLLAAGVLALLARGTSPADEGAHIRRRYRPLLVRVHPVPASPGRPVIDVTSFAELARLAERYGLLVLHWSSSDVETFIVHDDAGTFRYRTCAGLSSTTQSEAVVTQAGQPLPPTP